MPKKKTNNNKKIKRGDALRIRAADPLTHDIITRHAKVSNGSPPTATRPS